VAEVDASIPYDVPIQVLEADIDMMGHVNNTVYLRWVQDAATAHWNVVATKEELEDMLWVVVKHEITYKHPALLEDHIIAATYLGKRKANYLQRYTDIRRASDDKILAKAVTLWCPLDAKTMKPIRLTEEQKLKYSNE